MSIKKWIFDNLFADYKKGYEFQLQTITKISEGFNARLQELEKIPEEVQKQKDLEDKLNSKYPKKVITYNGRNIPNHGQIKIDVRGFFVNPISSELTNIVRPWLDLPDDQKAFKCLEWVIDHIKYVPDLKNFGLNEFWSYPNETLSLRKGDCDSGSILLANLMMACNVQYWKVRVTAGSTIAGGHCWICYFRESDETWVVLDWCFFPTKKSIKSRSDYKNDKNYGKVWFSFNKNYAFQKG